MFGNKLNQAAEFHFNTIKPGERILLVGGGTGKILENLPHHCHVTYIDSSSHMLRKAQKVNYDGDVDSIHDDIRSWRSQTSFDVIIFPFILDLFEDTEIHAILQQIISVMAPKGRLLVSDFYPTRKVSRLKNRILLRSTLLFFKVLTGHKLKDVPNIKDSISAINLELTDDYDVIPGMVFASVWRKPVY